MSRFVVRAVAFGLRVVSAALLLASLACNGETPTDLSPSTVSLLLVAPETVVLAPAQTAHFTASAKRDDGATVPVPVVWSATGGTIDSNGNYVAGAGAGRFWVSARLRGGKVKGEATLHISPAAAVLDSLRIDPDTVSLEAGAREQFTAHGFMSDGSDGWVRVAWTATGGSVDTAGNYVAGATAGVFRVIAAMGGKADTAAVVITAAPGPSPPPPAPPSPPPPSPPPPASTARGCPQGGYTRLVTVSTNAELADALGAARPGDQIRIAAGTYSGNQSLGQSGTAASPLVLCGMAGAAPVLKGGQFSSTASYLTITGVVFEGAASAESVNPVYLHSAHDVTFTGNEIRGGHYHAGLSTDEIHHMVITYNYIHDNGHDTSHDHGIYFKTTTGDGNVIANNVLVRNAARGISLHDNTGVGVYDVLVTQNTIVGNGSTGILVNDGDRITVANNISAFNGDATDQSQIRVLAGDHNRAYNNLTYSTTSSRAGIENATASLLSGNRIGNPMFANGETDLHLQAGSPAVGLGQPDFAIGPDYDGRTRDAAPDAGAYER